MSKQYPALTHAAPALVPPRTLSLPAARRLAAAPVTGRHADWIRPSALDAEFAAMVAAVRERGRFVSHAVLRVLKWDVSDAADRAVFDAAQAA